MEEDGLVSNFQDLVGGEIYSIKSPATCLLPLVHQIAFLYKNRTGVEHTTSAAPDSLDQMKNLPIIPNKARQ